MRMVDYYNCTSEVYPVYPVEIKCDARGGGPKIGQYPNMSVEYHEHPEDGPMSAFRLSSIGHNRLVARASFILGDHDYIQFGISWDGEILMYLTCSPTRKDNVLHVRNRQSGSNNMYNSINVVEMNERCKRPMPAFAGTKSGDTFQFEFDTISDRVRTF